MIQIPVAHLGGFRLQYTDAAQSVIKSLDTGLGDRLHDHLLALAEKNPYAGDTVPLGNSDRRMEEFEELATTFWLARDLKVMTVVNIAVPEDESDED